MTGYTSHDALIICTRNRHHQLAARIEEFRHFGELPTDILIVDSSEADDTEVLINSLAAGYPTGLHYLRTSSGLPFQRNCGINWVLQRPRIPEIIHFLDDDIVPRQDYFFKVKRLFGHSPESIAIGGFDVNYDPKLNQTFLRRIFGIGSSKTGVILKSGIAIPPVPTQKLEEFQWLVGGMQSFRTRIFDSERFDSGLRMYGEDVDFYLRIRSLGKIHCSRELPITHLYDPTNRDSYRNVCLYHDGVRWLFAVRYPHYVKHSRVWLAALALAGGEIGSYIATGTRRHLQGARGHLEFLVRLAKGKQVVQTNERHSEEGLINRDGC